MKFEYLPSLEGLYNLMPNMEFFRQRIRRRGREDNFYTVAKCPLLALPVKYMICGTAESDVSIDMIVDV